MYINLTQQEYVPGISIKYLLSKKLSPRLIHGWINFLEYSKNSHFLIHSLSGTYVGRSTILLHNL
jgi:hypothetical protein